MSMSIYRSIERIEFSLNKKEQPRKSSDGDYQVIMYFEDGKLRLTTWIHPSIAECLPEFDKWNTNEKEGKNK